MSLISRLTTWVSNQILTSSALNGEFNNIVNLINNLDAGTTTWTNVKTSALTATGTTITVNGVTLPKARTRQIFTSGSGTYTTPAGTLYILVRCVGAGGGGGGSSTCAAGQSSPGGGGAGGAYCEKLITSPSATYSYAVGTGGSGGAAGGNAGTSGGNTTFGTALLAANGGSGGGGGGTASTTLFAPSVPGGSASGGDLNVVGGYSIPGITSGNGSQVSGGGGGSSVLSGAVFSSSNSTVGGTGGTGYGGGGSGGQTVASGTQQPGAAGSNGVIIVDEFYS